MGKIKKVLTIIFLMFSIGFSIISVRYLVLVYDALCFKSWDCDEDWEPPEYYKDGDADSKIEECAQFGADNLVFSQYCNGKYKYIYDAEKDEYNESDYSIVRHAGATYALLDLYKEIGEKRYLQAGMTGLEYLISFNHVITLDEWVIDYNLDMNVGTVSLTILGMVRYWEATDDDRYNIFVEKYANFIVSQQRDDGAYAGRYGSKTEELYYSGEAFFALALAYKMLEKKEYLNSIEDALDFYWDDDYEYNNSAFIPWASSGCARWYELTEKQKFMDFCFEMTDIQILRQNLVSSKDELGNELYGYMKNPTVNTGVYLEGIGDALRIAKAEKDTARITSYKNCIKAGLEWVLSLQYRIESQLACPNRGFGGFHRGFIVDFAFQVRIDYTQHAISAILRALREFNSTEVDAIEIRDGIVDFDPKKGEPEEFNWWIYVIIIALLGIPSIIIIILIKNSLSLKKKKSREILTNLKEEN